MIFLWMLVWASVAFVIWFFIRPWFITLIVYIGTYKVSNRIYKSCIKRGVPKEDLGDMINLKKIAFKAIMQHLIPWYK